MDLREPRPPPDAKWAYAYRITRPQTAPRLKTIERLLDDAHAVALREGRRWTSRVIVEQEFTHLLIVADSPSQDGEINRRLEAELTHLDTAFSITPSLAIGDARPQAG